MSAELPRQGDEATGRSSGKGRSGGAALMVLFSATIFLSAALLFLIQPMFAKFILPLFGSTPAVWTGSMLFFQAALLASYLYVHITTTLLGARKQAVLHLVLVLLPMLVFLLSGPLAVPAEDWAPSTGTNPIFLLLGLLLVSVGLPFFAISATNPLIQRWLADTDHPAAKDPYFLYRASNLGSVIGLLGYPLVLEPRLELVSQGFWWTVGYGLLIVLVLASAVLLWRSAPARNEADAAPDGEELEEAPAAGPSGGAPTALRRLRWVGLTFVPSSLMLGVTAFITTDITPIPLLWVLPLSLYLFSFVLVFSPNQATSDLTHKLSVAALPVAMALLVFTIITDVNSYYWLLIVLHILGFFVVATALHGEVARDRPPARYLTEFYLWVSVGGVLGGIFNALIAPLVFDTVVEYPFAIVLACVFLPAVVLSRMFRTRGGGEGGRRGASRLAPVWLDLALPLALGVAVAALAQAAGGIEAEYTREFAVSILVFLAVMVCLYFAYVSHRALRFGLGIAAVIVAGAFTVGATDAFYQERSFFGVYRVSGEEVTDPQTPVYHALVVGETNHGAQILGVQPPVPTTYYHRTGPIGQAFEALPEETTSRVAGLGLGTGSLACYNKPGQNWDFYEIDPLIGQIASDEDLFTYLNDCPGQSDVVLGDARLSLADAPDGEYGMIVGDAFSSDAIPVHLITREAMELYLQKLNENGVMAFHISNRHLELEPVLGNLAQDVGLECRTQNDEDTEDYPGKFVSHWVVMSRAEEDLGGIPDDARWSSCDADPSQNVWTDDFSNLLSTFNWN